MTNLPSREELEQAIFDYADLLVGNKQGNPLADDDVLRRQLGRLFKLLDSIYSLGEAGSILTINDVRTKILGWPPLPPDDHRGNSLLRRDP